MANGRVSRNYDRMLFMTDSRERVFQLGSKTELLKITRGEEKNKNKETAKMRLISLRQVNNKLYSKDNMTYTWWKLDQVTNVPLPWSSKSQSKC